MRLDYDCSRSNFLPVRYGDKSTGTAASLDVLWSVLTLGGGCMGCGEDNGSPLKGGECFGVEVDVPVQEIVSEDSERLRSVRDFDAGSVTWSHRGAALGHCHWRVKPVCLLAV
ncbi:unnamed protein product [Arctogadus glacialis]